MRKYASRLTAALLLFGATIGAAPAEFASASIAASAVSAAADALVQSAPDPSPSAAPPPSSPAPHPAPAALRLSQVQFVDAKHGWTVGAAEGSSQSLVWRTTNGGKAWHAATLGGGVQDAALGMATLTSGWAVGPSDCRADAGAASCGKLNILHTKDGSRTWTSQWSKSDPSAGPDNQVAAVSEETAFVRAGTSIRRTTDGGKTWLDASVPGSEAAPYGISFVDESVGYAAGRVGTECPAKGLVPSSPNADCKTAVWKTTDGGKSWKRLSHAPRHGGAWYPADIQFTDKSNGFLLLVNPDTHGSLLYATENGGINWKLRNSTISGIRPYPVKLDFVNSRTGYIPLSVGAGPVDGGLLRTANGGVSFDKLKDPRLVSVEDADFLRPHRGYVIAMNPDNPASRLLLGTTDGGGKWTDLTPTVT